MFAIPSLPFFLVSLLPVVIATKPLSFNLPTFSPSDAGNNINITGDANITTQGIQLTPQNRSLMKGGRAIYVKPLDLWDKDSGNLTSFSSNFSFVIDSNGDTKYADGIAFILVPVGSDIPAGSVGLGLGYGTMNSLNSYVHPESFVAVEFDTYVNPEWDPPYAHVGISNNSIRSVAEIKWKNDITGGAENNAWITYDASSMVLRVDFTSFLRNETRTIGTLSYKIDLRQSLPERVIFGFSAATGSLSEIHTLKSWNFSSLEMVTPTEPGPTPHGKGNRTGLIVGSVVGLLVLILVLAFASYYLRKKKHKKGCKDDEFIDMDNEFEKGSGPKKFSYNELVQATSNFTDEEKLGQGGFGGVYKGWLRETNSYVAVKRVSRGSKQGLKEYASEVKIISQLRHKNLVQLIGWCHERGELLLVYEFMPNGSLDSHLFRGKLILSWEVRHKIALGLASSLLYLHEEWERCVVHRDIKSSNIMLDSSFNAKLGDFGLARLVDHEKGPQTTVVAGTMGYMAPECVITPRATKESDIYSFGIVLLEIACGRRTMDERLPEGQMRLVEWVWSLYGLGKLVDAVDPKLGMKFDAQEMECLMVLGLWCAHPDSEHRPSIRQAIHVLMFEVDVPALPPMMPVARYLAPTMAVNSCSSGHSTVVLDSRSDIDIHYTPSANATRCSSSASTLLPR